MVLGPPLGRPRDSSPILFPVLAIVDNAVHVTPQAAGALAVALLLRGRARARRARPYTFPEKKAPDGSAGPTKYLRRALFFPPRTFPAARIARRAYFRVTPAFRSALRERFRPTRAKRPVRLRACLRARARRARFVLPPRPRRAELLRPRRAALFVRTQRPFRFVQPLRFARALTRLELRPRRLPLLRARLLFRRPAMQECSHGAAAFRNPRAVVLQVGVPHLRQRPLVRDQLP